MIIVEDDQRQDVGGTAEEYWDNFQAEGIPADVASGIPDEIPEPPISLQVSLRKMSIWFLSSLFGIGLLFGRTLSFMLFSVFCSTLSFMHSYMINPGVPTASSTLGTDIDMPSCKGPPVVMDEGICHSYRDV